MERQRNNFLPTCKNLGLAKIKVRVTNFCKSVKFLYIKELSAKNVKMSKMSVVLKSYTCVCAYIHAYTHTHHAREINWHFDILTFLEFILLIFNELIDLQKLHFWFFIFASPNFWHFKTIYLDMWKQITLTGWKTEYLAFEGTKRFLGINTLVGRIESRSGQI